MLSIWAKRRGFFFRLCHHQSSWMIMMVTAKPRSCPGLCHFLGLGNCKTRVLSGSSHDVCSAVRLSALFITEDPCPRTRPWSARNGPRTGVLGNGKCTHWQEDSLTHTMAFYENQLDIRSGNLTNSLQDWLFPCPAGPAVSEPLGKGSAYLADALSLSVCLVRQFKQTPACELFGLPNF